jgi:hypothetical protein
MEDGVALDYERVAKLKRLAAFLEEQIFYESKIDEKAADLIGIRDLLDAAEDTSDKESLSNIARMILDKLDPSDPKNHYPHIWARDVKGIGGGRTVDIVRFNAVLLAEYRAILAEIAQETGGRRQRTVTENIDYSKLTEEQLQRVAGGEDPIQVILSEYVPGS